MEIQRKNLYSIDIAKFIFSIFVVGIHTHPFKSFGEIANQFTSEMLFRFAVPFFFVSSGYFLFSKMQFSSDGKLIKCDENKKRLISYVKRITIMYVIWSVVYYALQAAEWFADKSISFIHLVISFVSSFFINGSYYHFWYIVCLIYSMPIIYFLLRRINVKVLTVAAVGLYLIKAIPNSYGWFSLGVFSTISSIESLTGCIFSTFFVAIPFIAFGIFFSQRENNHYKFKNIVFIVLAVLYFVEAGYIYLIQGYEKTNYTVILLPTVVVLFMILKQINVAAKKPDCFVIMRKLSVIIYCIHPLVIAVLKYIVEYNSINSFLWFLIILSVSLLLSIIIYYISKRLKCLRYLY